MNLLSHTAEYALRVVALLALQESADLVDSATISEETRVPPAYLSKVLRRLVTAGLVRARRGRSGGFALARPAREIRFAEVLEAVGEVREIDACAFGLSRCNPKDPCPLHPAWTELTRCFHQWAEATTLAAATPGGPVPHIPDVFVGKTRGP